MIKNKVMDIKIIFKIYLKILKTTLGFQTDFYFIKYQEKSFQKLFLKIILENGYETRPN